MTEFEFTFLKTIVEVFICVEGEERSMQLTLFLSSVSFDIFSS